MAKTTWGRKETIIWPHHRPIYTYGAIFGVSFLTLFLCGLRSHPSGDAVAAVLPARL